ncbi:MAG: glycosyltransferase [Ferruginibacter sp.]
MATVIVSVISDLVTDQRVHRTAQTLHEMGFDVLLTGTKKKNSLPLNNRSYPTKRFNMVFQKGFLFYAEWNTRLFFFLLSRPADILLANDLDTLPANFLVSKIRSRIQVYDTHEFFTGTAELYNRSFVKKTWQRIENFFFPRVKYIYTVNKSIAALYKDKYGIEPVVIRNLPYKKAAMQQTAGFDLPAGKKILLVQGTGLNENRGLEELVSAVALLPETFMLVIAGGGLIIPALKNSVAKQQLQERILFTGVLDPVALRQLTPLAWCGFSLDKPININQQASLPNKLFDYIAAGIPVIASDIMEVAAIVRQYGIGTILPQVSPEAIATAVLELDANETNYQLYKSNTAVAYETLNWENEQQILRSLFIKITAENNISIG